MKWSIEDFVYGATDGAVTTFAIVAGVLGDSLSPSVVLILGLLLWVTLKRILLHSLEKPIEMTTTQYP